MVDDEVSRAVRFLDFEIPHNFRWLGNLVDQLHLFQQFWRTIGTEAYVLV